MLIRNPNDYLRIFYDTADDGGGGAAGTGAGSGEGAGSGAGEGEGQGAGSGATAATLTQADVDRIVGREKAEAKKAAEKQLADTLGVTVDEAKAIIDAKRTADEATKTETQKALEAAQAAQTAAETAKAEAARERFDAKVERALAAAGVPDTALARATRLISLDPDSDADAIATEIDTLKADVPGLFTTAPAAGTRPPSGVTGARPPAGGQGSVTPLERGRDLWKQQTQAS